MLSTLAPEVNEIMFKSKVLPLLLPLLLTIPFVQADEVWNTNTGKMVYDSDQGSTAVWTYGEKEQAGVIYILGLARVYQNRTRYDGYWAQKTAKQKCNSERIGLNGKLTPYWGRLQIRFIDKDFPSRWEALWSYCDQPAQANKIIGTPITAQ
jgi:hypothetical protein